MSLGAFHTHNKTNRLYKRWLSFSLRRKLGVFTWVMGTVVLASVLSAFLVSGFGMLEFGTVLGHTSRSLEFWSSMEQESRAFAAFQKERTGERKKALSQACLRTETALGALPFDYEAMGSGRYAKTWSIRNSYAIYRESRDKLLESDGKEAGYVEALYRVYRMQDYIENYARSLEQMNVEAGNDKFEERLPLFALFPLAAVMGGGICLLAMIFTHRSLGRSVIEPVLQMAEESRRIAVNDFGGPELESESMDEVGELVRAFQNMKTCTQGYIVTLQEKLEVERKLDNVRLQMLKDQINPHFLFNTLNMIASMAEIEEADGTGKMITALSRLFRYNLKSTDSVMPLEREIKVVEDYMYLQKMRFGERLHFEVRCKPETLELLVPSFALQPLVENAIVHGTSKKVDGGKILIRSWMKEGRLWLSVADTGGGIEEGRLKQIWEVMGKKGDGQIGVGLGNINQRIRAMYPDGEMRVYSKEGRGTIVQMAFTPE